MTPLTVRDRLLGSATIGLCGAVALLAFAGSAGAQTTTCSQTGTSVSCVDGVTPIASGTVDATTVVTSGPGFVATDPDSATVNLTSAGNGPIATAGNGEDAFSLVAPNSLTVDFDGSLATGGDGAVGLDFIASAGSATIAVQDISTAGANSDGVVGLSGGLIDLTTGTVSTGGDSSFGMLLSAGTSLDLNAVNISTMGTGSHGLNAVAGTTFNAQLGGISTQGDSSFAMVLTAGSNMTLSIDSILTSGTSAHAGSVIVGGDGDISIGSITTTGLNSVGPTISIGQNAILDIGSISTSGDNGAAGSISVGSTLTGTIDSVTTTGANGDGLSISAGVAMDLDFGSISTAGDGSIGLVASAGATMDLEIGSLSTAGTGSHGMSLVAGSTLDLLVGTLSTTGDSSAGMTVTAGDTANLTIGSISTSGTSSAGATVSGGNIANVTIDSITTTGDGISISAGTAADVDIGTIATTGDNSFAASISAGVGITGTIDSITTSGLDSDGVTATAGASLNLTTGNISTAGNDSYGILTTAGLTNLTTVGNVSTLGSNSFGVQAVGPAVTVVAGNVTTAGADSTGIIVVGDTGPAVVDAGVVAVSGANSRAVDVTSSTGSQSITVDGASAAGAGMEAILATGTGAAPITVNAQGNVSSATGIGISVNTLGTSAVNVQSGTTQGTTGINSVAAGGSTINIAGTVNGTAGPSVNADGGAAVLTVATGGVLNGFINLTDNADVVNVNGTWNASGTSQFGLGIDVVNNNSGNTINTVDGTVFADLEIFNNNATGLLNLGTGTTTFPATTEFNNAGTIRAVGGITTLASLAAVENSGVVDLLDGATNDVLTIASDFVGSGASTLEIDASSAAADRLIIDGAASGSTLVDVNFLGAVAINTDGILVVDTDTSSAGAFVLGDTFGTGLIDLSLIQDGADYFLFVVPNANAFDPLHLANATQDMWYQSADIYGNYSAIRRRELGNGENGASPWLQIYYSRDRYGDNESQDVFGIDMEIDGGIETHRQGVQAGVDFGTSLAVLGLTGGFESADVRLDGTSTSLDLDGWNIGAYALFGSGAGFYGGLLAKYDRNQLELQDAAFADVGELTAKSMGVEGEAGYRFGSGSLRFDLGGGLAWVQSKVEDFTTGGIAYDFDTTTSLRGRVGGRAELGTRVVAFLDARLLHDFEGDSDVTLTNGLSSDELGAKGRGTWARLEAGFDAAAAGGPMAAVWTEFGDVKGIGIKAGWRIGRRASVQALPAQPPAPPAPLPPTSPAASQTCPNGTMVLATDACPPLPAVTPERG